MPMAHTSATTWGALLESLQLAKLATSVFHSVLILGAVVLAAFLLERRAGEDPERYKSRAFLNDVIYSLFYRGGFFNIFLFSALSNALQTKLAFLRPGLWPSLPLPVALALFWIGGDFILYWVHRWQHANGVLWAFHSVHHTQARLTTLTQYRRHPLDRGLLELSLFVVFGILLGIPSQQWPPLYVVFSVFQALQHAELNWRFGRLYPLIVSPVFHSIHHSPDLQQQNSNFGAMFSLWDHLFGTAVRDAPRPTRYGVAGSTVPERIMSQLWVPFRLALRPNDRAVGPPEGPEISHRTAAPLHEDGAHRAGT
jgi:sterol desaturase/sphingolipid hydroxylase (fatty acid hydroxylase superfamily)